MSADLDAIDRAATELADARRKAREGRRAFRHMPIVSVFVRAMQKAISLYREARAQGVSREDACRGLEEELRGAWPKTVSKFRPACDACEDTGWVEHTCWDQQRCGRKLCAVNPDRQHLYVTPCHCAAGDKKRPRQFTPDDVITAAGRTQKKKARGWRQVGA